jgi:hypothetical protein
MRTVVEPRVMKETRRLGTGVRRRCLVETGVDLFESHGKPRVSWGVMENRGPMNRKRKPMFFILFHQTKCSCFWTKDHHHLSTRVGTQAEAASVQEGTNQHQHQHQHKCQQKEDSSSNTH